MDTQYEEFAAKKINIGLGFIMDGVNFYGNQSRKHSIWHFHMKIYNVPLWLINKKKFIALTLLIPSENAPIAGTIDIFLILLKRDFRKL